MGVLPKMNSFTFSNILLLKMNTSCQIGIIFRASTTEYGERERNRKRKTCIFNRIFSHFVSTFLVIVLFVIEIELFLDYCFFSGISFSLEFLSLPLNTFLLREVWWLSARALVSSFGSPGFESM